MARDELKKLVRESGLAAKMRGRKTPPKDKKYHTWTRDFTQEAINIFNREQSLSKTAEILEVSHQNICMMFKRKNVEIVQTARFKNRPQIKSVYRAKNLPIS